jgi:protein arginine N-methyltransferase 1
MAPTTNDHAARAKAAARSLLGKTYEAAARNDRVRRLVYSLRNRNLFGGMAQHDHMLGDPIRVDTYHAAIEKHVKEGDVVADLGTGSGVLAFFASRAGARQVHAIEHGPMADAAEAVAADNGIENVRLHRMHSSEFELPEKVDVIVHEQIGEALFDERVVENVGELRDRVLKPGGLILPARLALYIEPVQVRDGARRPYAWQQRLHGIDFRALEPFARREPQAYHYTVLRPFPFEQFLTATAAVVSVDLHTATTADLPAQISWRRPVVVDGILDGFVVYFTAAFDDELAISSSPADPYTHWGGPLLRVESRPVRAGDELEFALSAKELSAPSTWEWTVTVHPGAAGTSAA